MNVLYCGDKFIIDGLIISVLSLLKNVKEPLNIYVLTMKYKNNNKEFESMPQKYITKLDKIVKSKNKNNFIKLIDVTDIVNKCPPTANIDTRFTPYCMLRLYVDEVKELPDKILYLDNDVVCLNNPYEFYNMDNTNYELIGVLDNYGSHFYKKDIFKKDYINSGVLLMNLSLIKETELLKKCRIECQEKKMLLPDQAALNRFSEKKLIVDRIYNEQKKENKDTVFRHFTTTFKIFPLFHPQTIKPWNIEELHNTLNCYMIDDLLDKYIEIREEIENE